MFVGLGTVTVGRDWKHSTRCDKEMFCASNPPMKGNGGLRKVGGNSVR